MTLVIIMRFRVARDRHQEWEGFVADRSQEIAGQPGFSRMYLLRPEGKENEYRVVSWWDQLDKPLAWIRKQSYTFSESDDHQGIVVGPIEHEILQIVKQF
jgi:heme-degrading monooxygenase HmoA